MKAYRIKIRILSALGTLPAADTLFGHICWSIRQRKGEPALKEFLTEFDNETLPLIFSDPFPENHLPIPLLPRPKTSMQQELKSVFGQIDRNTLQKIFPDYPLQKDYNSPNLSPLQTGDFLKWLLKREYMSLDALKSLKDNCTLDSIFRHMIQNGCGKINTLKKAVMQHNTVDRMGRGTVEGGLFFTEEYFIDTEDPPVMDIYAYSGKYDASGLKDLFSEALAGGYGKYKYRGKGNIQVADVEQIELPASQNPNAAILLSHCVPAKNDPTDGYWQLKTKFPRLGGDWATGPGPHGQPHNPFKKPMIMLRPGSVFKTNDPKPYYGQLLENIHPDFSEVRHYAIAPALPIRIEFKEAL